MNILNRDYFGDRHWLLFLLQIDCYEAAPCCLSDVCLREERGADREGNRAEFHDTPDSPLRHRTHKPHGAEGQHDSGLYHNHQLQYD